jgi:putative methylase
MSVRHSELVRALARVASPVEARPELEQVATPPEAAAELLFAAVRLDGLTGRPVLDLGAGTGRLAIGAALLGAAPVTAVEVDPRLVEVARESARAAHVTVDFVVADVTSFDRPADLVVMNPPFGAQRAHADRPFWDRGLALARRSVHAFALRDSRTFIARRVVERGAQVLETHPIAWELPRTFPHHTRRRVTLAVDRWAIRTEPIA